MNGAAQLLDVVLEATDGDDDYTGTVYPNDNLTGRIIAVQATIGEDVNEFASPEHPMAVRAMVEVELLRVRIGNARPRLKELRKAFMDKLRNNELIQQIFRNEDGTVRITAITSEAKPPKDGITSKYPWIGVKSVFEVPDQQYGGQREERLKMRCYIYQQRYPKQLTESVLGD